MKIILVCFTLFLMPESFSQDSKLHSYIIEKILPQTSRVKEFQWQREKYWLKKSTGNNVCWVQRLGRELGSAIIPIVFLKPTPYGNKNPLELEKERLLECAQLKINCPRLIDYGTNWLVMADAGVSAEEYLKRLPRTQRFEFILKLLNTIFDNQKKGFFHGRYYLRDMLVSSMEKIFVFDIEENPTHIMDIPNAKAREIFHFIVSASAVLSDIEIKQLGLWLNEHIDKETKKRLLILKDYKQALNFLDFFKGYLGRDPTRFLQAAFFIMDNITIEKKVAKP